jgi:hypothetical protein
VDALAQYTKYKGEIMVMTREEVVQEAIKKIESVLLWDLTLYELGKFEDIMREIYDDAYKAAQVSV